jgi:peptide/nickel transport system substrate-binding protein
MEIKQTRESLLRLGGAVGATAVAGGFGAFEAGVANAQGAPSDMPRARTLRMVFGGGGGKFTDAGIGNPYAAGATHQIGNAALWEPLFYYSAFADDMIPWLATGYSYSEDFTSLTVNIRRGAEWGDGKPFTANDVAFTFNLLRGNTKLTYGTAMKQFVTDVEAIDAGTVKFTFTAPNPRFLFEYLAFKFDNGVKLLPKHIFEDKDPIEFQWFDLEKGWPCGTGPYKITLWNETQKFMDLRQDWWGAKSMFATLPMVERIIFTPFSDDNRTAQLLASNEIDAALDLRPGTLKALLPQNKALITHSFNRPPFGYVDWWPNSFWINTTLEPWNDPEIRWALSYAIDRQGAIDVAYDGAGQATELPYPAYPPLKPYADAVKPLLAKYPTNKYDLGEVDKRMKAKGYAKDGAGFWAKGGKRLVVDIYGWAIWADIGPVVAEQLRKAGFQSSYSMPPDWSNRAMLGEHPGGWFFGHGASIADPYYTMYLFTSINSIPQSTTSGGGGNQWSRWSNKDFDKIVEAMALVPMGDPRLLDLFYDGMAIWLKELPNLPFIQWFHRIPMNTTYWQGWPTVLNSYCNGAFWHLTFPLVLHRLKPTGA